MSTKVLNVAPPTSPKTRPKVLPGKTYEVQTGCGGLYVTVNRDNGTIAEVFVTMGKTGQCGAAQTETIGRCISVGLRSGIPAEVFIKQLKGVRCPSQNNDTLSCADAIARAIEENCNEGNR